MYYVKALMTKMERKVYTAWYSMIARCRNPNNNAYADYGGRGICVCERWKKRFENFLEDVGLPPGPEYSIDRTDPNGNYEPGVLADGRPKVKWALLPEQHRNRRNTRWVTIGDVTEPASTWAARAGVDKITFHKRLESGMTGEDLLRPTNFHIVKYDVGDGRTLTVQEIVVESGCTQTGIWLRIQRGVRGADLLAPSRTKHHKGFRIGKEEP